MSVTSPVTGAAQTGLTSPTYTLASATAPDVNGRQYNVTALGGTQTGVDISSASKPFTITGWWPKLLQTLTYVTGSGKTVKVPMNVYKWVTRKGVLVNAELPPITMVITTTVEAPAGADVADPANVKAAQSLHFGAVYQASAGTGDTVISGTP